MATASQQTRMFATLLEKYGRAIAMAFLRATAQARNTVNMAQLQRAIDAGDVVQVIEVLNYGSTTLLPVTEEMRAAFVAGGVNAAELVPRGAVFGFDARNPRADAWILERAATLIQGIETDTLAMVRTVMLDRVQSGRSSASVALDMVGRMKGGRRTGGFLGLTSEQTDWAMSARQQLLDLDGGYLRRGLRDRRYDAMVQRAIDSGKPLTQPQIDTITGRYKDRVLNYRATTVAKNEAHTAAAAGQREGFEQLVQSGKVDGVTKRWQHNDGGQDFREDHVSMGMAPARPFDEPFVFPDGASLQYPHDPAGGAEHSIGCRCVVIYRPIIESAA